MPEDSKPSFEKVMSFGDHLVELRRRILISIFSVVVAFALIFFIFEGRLIDVIRWPFERALSWMDPVITTRTGKEYDTSELTLKMMKVTEVFLTKLKMAFTAAIVLSVPVWLHQVWLFVAPGLKLKERRAIFPSLFFGTFLFMTGALMAYMIVIPFAIRFFLHDALWNNVDPILSFGWYVDFETMLMLVFGVAFELPLVITILTLVGIVTPKLLTTKRKYAILIMFIAAAVLTPQDVFTQLLLAGPLLVLYEISVVLSKYFYKRRWSTRWGYLDDDDSAPSAAAVTSPRPAGGGPDADEPQNGEQDEDPYSHKPEHSGTHWDYDESEYDYEREFSEYEDPYADHDDEYGAVSNRPYRSVYETDIDPGPEPYRSVYDTDGDDIDNPPYREPDDDVPEMQ